MHTSIRGEKIHDKKIIYPATSLQFFYAMENKSPSRIYIYPIRTRCSGMGDFEHNAQVDNSKQGWGYNVGIANLKDEKDSNALFAIVNSNQPDEGVIVKLYVAIALGKVTFLLRDDACRCTDFKAYPINLILFSELAQNNWEDLSITSLKEISFQNKSLYQWINN